MAQSSEYPYCAGGTHSILEPGEIPRIQIWLRPNGYWEARADDHIGWATVQMSTKEAALAKIKKMRREAHQSHQVGSGQYMRRNNVSDTKEDNRV